MGILDITILLVTILGLTYVRASAVIWTIATAIVLLFVTFLGKTSILFLVVVWFLYLLATSFIYLKTWRQKYFTKPLIRVLESQMPPISRTEREAIEAGNVWWEKELFCGQPNWRNFLTIPSPRLTEEEQFFLDNPVETLCSMLNDWEIVNTKHDLPEAIWNYLKQERFFGLVIPKEYGGLGFSALAHSTIVMKIATRSATAAVNMMVPNSLGPAELLFHYGTEEQKYYLPRLAVGEEIPCFALTGPEAGSDAASITDTGIVCQGEYQGKTVLGLRLTWDKRYITLAPIATLLGLAFRLYDPENLLGKGEDLGITLCLLPTNHPGVSIGHRHLPLKLTFMNGPTSGKDVFIPMDWIIGGVDRVGQGWQMLMECLSIGRSTSLPALATACSKLVYRTTSAYAQLRRQFHVSIAHFEGVEEALSNIAGMLYLIESCRLFTVSALNQNVKPAIASAIAKYHMTEMGRKIILHALDIHGGHGIQMGPRNILAHLYLAAPISITVEGANILTRSLIIFGQGAIRCHPYVLKEIELLTSQSADRVEQLDKTLLAHMGYLLSNGVKCFWRGLTAGKLIFSPVRGVAAPYYRQLTRMSSALALLSDISMMILGGRLKRKERLSARLGDMLSQLYLASAALKYFHDHGSPYSDVDYIKWSVKMCLYQIQVACDELLDNFPIGWLGKLLYWIIFPYGRSYLKPNDYLSHNIVTSMLLPSEFRDRLTRYCFISDDANDALKRMEDALLKLVEVEPLLKKQKAGAALSVEELRVIEEFEALRKEVIKVNEFSFDLSEVIS